MTESKPGFRPPAFEATNTVELVSESDSKILSVSVYSGRAEVTRLFKFSVKTGQNQIVITGLPSAMDQESFRVEGRGSATIHDVTISRVDLPPVAMTSEKLEELQAELTKVSKALVRAQKALSSVEAYIGSLNTEHVDVTKLQDIIDSYETASEKLDSKITELEGQKKKLEKNIEEEKKILDGPQANEKLDIKAAIGVFADSEGEIKIALIYAVWNASWSATYDIRVNMQTKEKPVSLIYKGAIIQSTGEDWTDVPISLETAAPTFGVEIPTLSRWTISTLRRLQAFKKVPAFRTSGLLPPAGFGVDLPEVKVEASSVGYSPALAYSPEGSIKHRSLQVSSKGTVTATFSVPGLMSIPSDGVVHNVTIVKLSLDADMEWVSVPKQLAKVHLKAIVKNASDYTLLSGPASVYVDGSFIARSEVPGVSPDETFDCPLGLDPSIRATYSPVSKKVAQVGFMNKSRLQTYTQRITIHNTKSTPVSTVKVLDQIPISEESIIAVKLITPLLPTVDKAAGNSGSNNASSSTSVAKLLQGKTVENKLGVKVPAPIVVSPGIVAQWDGMDEVASEVDLEDLGSEGRVEWSCKVPAQGKVVLVLQWEVLAPLRAQIAGL